MCGMVGKPEFYNSIPLQILFSMLLINEPRRRAILRRGIVEKTNFFEQMFFSLRRVDLESPCQIDQFWLSVCRFTMCVYSPFWA